MRYLHVDTGQQVWQENWEQIFGAFRTRYPDVTLQIDNGAFGDPVIQKAISTFAAGDYYDVLYGHNSFVAPWLGADLLQPLDGFLSKDREVAAADYHPAATERLKGKLYGIAWFVVGAETWYNADLLAQSGAPNPRQLEKEGKWTWDALLDVARKATRIEGGQTSVWGFDAPWNQVLWFNHILWAWGAESFDKGFTKPTFDSPGAVNATQFAMDMIARHRVAGPGDFTKSALATRLISTSYIRTIEEQVMRQNPFKVEMTMIPKGPSGRAVGLTNNASYLARGAKAPEAAWLFYKHLIGKDVAAPDGPPRRRALHGQQEAQADGALPLRGRHRLRGRDGDQPADAPDRQAGRPRPGVAPGVAGDGRGQEGRPRGPPAGAGPGHPAAQGRGLPVLTAAHRPPPARRARRRGRDPWPAVRAICDRFVAWQAPSGGISVERCPYHRPPLLRGPIAYGQDLPWIVRALYGAYDAGGDEPVQGRRRRLRRVLHRQRPLLARHLRPGGRPGAVLHPLPGAQSRRRQPGRGGPRPLPAPAGVPHRERQLHQRRLRPAHRRRRPAHGAARDAPGGGRGLLRRPERRRARAGRLPPALQGRRGPGARPRDGGLLPARVPPRDRRGGVEQRAWGPG